MLYCACSSDIGLNMILLCVILQPISVTDEEILEMIFFPVVNEACRVIEEGIVVRASDIDIASVHGFKFPSET